MQTELVQEADLALKMVAIGIQAAARFAAAGDELDFGVVNFQQPVRTHVQPQPLPFRAGRKVQRRPHPLTKPSNNEDGSFKRLSKLGDGRG